MEGRNGGPLTDAADVFDRAARAGVWQPARATSRSYQLRAMARLIHLLGRVSGDEDTYAALRLILDLAALGDTLADLRAAQTRWHQAQAAHAAAAALRSAVTTSTPLVTLPATLAATPLPTTAYQTRHQSRHTLGGRG